MFHNNVFEVLSFRSFFSVNICDWLQLNESAYPLINLPWNLKNLNQFTGQNNSISFCKFNSLCSIILRCDRDRGGDRPDTRILNYVLRPNETGQKSDALLKNTTLLLPLNTRQLCMKHKHISMDFHVHICSMPFHFF